jgi:hypothetical protein
LKNSKAIKGATKATYKIPKGTKKKTKYSVKITATVTLTGAKTQKVIKTTKAVAVK